MKGLVLLGDLSVGHGCFPPSPLIATPVTRTFFNNKLPGVVSPACYYAAHVCGNTTHQTPSRTFISGSNTMFIEGYPAARTDDPIACGDKAGPSISNTLSG